MSINILGFGEKLSIRCSKDIRVDFSNSAAAQSAAIIIGGRKKIRQTNQFLSQNEINGNYGVIVPRRKIPRVIGVSNEIIDVMDKAMFIEDIPLFEAACVLSTVAPDHESSL